MSERVWCAMCGQWGYHGSGSCPELHPPRSNSDIADLVISLILIAAGLAVLVGAATILATPGCAV